MSKCLSLMYCVSFRQYHKVGDKRKYWKVVEINDVPVARGKSLMNSCWAPVKLKYKTGILERYCARIVVKGYLRKDGFDLLSPLP